MMRRTLGLALALFPLIPAALTGQSLRETAPELFSKPLSVVQMEVSASRKSPNSRPALPAATRFGSWTTTAKWASLGAAAGFSILGFVLHEQADDRFARLEAACTADPDNCRDLNPDGSYRDPTLESLYQSVVGKDNQARASLIAAQLLFAGSAALFIIDFQRDSGPKDIPYEPEDDSNHVSVSLAPTQLVLRYYFH